MQQVYAVIERMRLQWPHSPGKKSLLPCKQAPSSFVNTMIRWVNESAESREQQFFMGKQGEVQSRFFALLLSSCLLPSLNQLKEKIVLNEEKKDPP